MTLYPWPVHPAATVFPEMTGLQLQELAADIATRGLIEPVCLYRDPQRGLMLLDGRSRAAACSMAGVHLASRTYEGSDPYGYAVSLNLHRRHLTPGQRALVGTRLAELLAAEAARRKSERSHDPVTGRFSRSEPVVAGLQQRDNMADADQWATKSVSRAAAAVGSSGRAVAVAQRLKAKAPDLAAEVQAGTMTLSAADDALRRRIANGQAPARTRTARGSLPEFARKSGWELRRAIERVERILSDDRFPAHRAKITAHLRSHLEYTEQATRDLLKSLTERTTGHD